VLVNRSAYGEVGAAVRKLWPLTPVVAVTATATPGTVEGMCKKLHVRDCKLLRSPVIRKKLKLHVQQVDMQSRTKDYVLLHSVQGQASRGGVLVFCRTKAECERVGTVLQRDRKCSVRTYHADLPEQHKQRTAEMIQRREVTVLVCTVAFGMGVDVAGVGCLIHWGAPACLEQYVQEIGRAGRSGDVALCLLLHGGNVYDNLTKRIPICHNARKELLQEAIIMQSYCGLAWRCRHAFISQVFGDDDAESCGDCCDVCVRKK
jgi:superfamily II DNA helicase RecQ